MSKIEWKSELDKLEVIGYLARPGVIGAMEATVPVDGVEKFKQEFDLGMFQYSNEFPYTAKKYGSQFRIYLQDTDGCPECLEKYLDDKYKNRINDTAFIRELVKKWGFKFTRGNQDYNQIIQHCELNLQNNEQRKAFIKGYRSYENFIEELKKKSQSDYYINAIIELSEPTQTNTKGRKKNQQSEENRTAYTKEQLLNLGWMGEKYVYKLLLEGNEEFLDVLELHRESIEIEWFNLGYEEDLQWIDKSIGQGCDIRVSDGNKTICLEVKTSKRKSNIFTMSTSEIIKMRESGSDYYIIKIDEMENLLKDREVHIRVFKEPYEKFFVAEMIKEATFKVK